MRLHTVVKKNQRVERLLLCVGGNFLPDGQVCQIKLHFQSPISRGCFLLLIKNKSPNPAHVCFFRPRRIMIYAQQVADVIEQLARPQRRLGRLLFFLWEASILAERTPEKCRLLFCISADSRGNLKK